MYTDSASGYVGLWSSQQGFGGLPELTGDTKKMVTSECIIV